jgi:hypothetical protein
VKCGSVLGPQKGGVESGTLHASCFIHATQQQYPSRGLDWTRAVRAPHRVSCGCRVDRLGGTRSHREAMQAPPCGAKAGGGFQNKAACMHACRDAGGCSIERAAESGKSGGSDIVSRNGACSRALIGHGRRRVGQAAIKKGKKAEQTKQKHKTITLKQARACRP